MADRKPALTGPTVAALSHVMFGRKGAAAQAKRLRKDWRAFVRDEFQLTTVQQNNLAAMPAAEAEKIQKALNDAVVKGGDVGLVLPAKSKDGTGELLISSEDQDQPGLVKTILRCTYDAECRNWRCEIPIL